MGNTLSDDDRDFILTSLSNLFSGIAPDETTVDKLRQYPTEQIRKIYFNEIAIACGFNLITTTPEIGGFDPQWLKEELSRIHSAKSSSLFGRIKFEFSRVFWGVCSIGLWRELEQKINAINATPKS